MAHIRRAPGAFLYVCVHNHFHMLEMLRQYVSGYVALSDQEFSFLADMLVIRSFDKRQQLTQAGEVENYLNFVVKGLVRMYFHRGATEVITNIAKEGELISSSASFLS